MKKIIIAFVAFFAMAISANAQKFAHVNMEEIQNSLPEITKLKGELQAAAQQYDNDLKAMGEEIQRKIDEYKKNEATMSKTAQEEQQKAIVEMQQKYQDTYQQNQQALQKKQQELSAPIQTKIQTAINNVGKAGQYTYIFDASAGMGTGIITYIGTGSKDVTAEVKAEINKLK